MLRALSMGRGSAKELFSSGGKPSPSAEPAPPEWLRRGGEQGSGRIREAGPSLPPPARTGGAAIAGPRAGLLGLRDGGGTLQQPLKPAIAARSGASQDQTESSPGMAPSGMWGGPRGVLLIFSVHFVYRNLLCSAAMIGQEGETQERDQKCFSLTIKYVGLKEISLIYFSFL